MAHRERVHGQIEALFEEGWAPARFSGLRRGFRPNLDSFHTAVPHELTVLVEVPGVDPRSLAVVVSERTLVIAGERRREKAEGRVYQQMEIEYGRFERRVRLVEDIDPGRARATFAHGLLTIVLPISEKRLGARRHTISVERL